MLEIKLDGELGVLGLSLAQLLISCVTSGNSFCFPRHQLPIHPHTGLLRGQGDI